MFLRHFQFLLAHAICSKLRNEGSIFQHSARISGLDARPVDKAHKRILVPSLEEISTDRAQLDEYIRTTNSAPNGSKDLSKVRKGDLICLEGSPCKISRVSSTGRLTLVEGISLIDDLPYAAKFDHCYGVTVSTFSGRPDLLQCLIVSFHPPATNVLIKAK